MTNNNFYAVTVTCGHVGRGKCIIKTFAIEAENGKEAAKVGRWLPRVKHHYKYCVVDVKKISYEAYQILYKENDNDPYFKCKNIQEQRKSCPNIQNEVIELITEKKIDKSKRKEKVEFMLRKSKNYKNEAKLMIRNYDDSLMMMATC